MYLGKKTFFLMVGRGGGGRQCILMHKGGIFMLVANNAKPLCGGLAHRGSEPFVMAGEKD